MIRFYLLFVFFILLVDSNAQTNRALLIAIDQYPPESGWEEIHATNDCKLMKRILQKKGYKNKDIQILINEQATKQNIIRQLNALYNNVMSGDYIYIHFSCHGQQMMDDNGDEDDGLDEALIPYDAVFWYSPDEYEGENHLRDDELGKWLKRLRAKTGENGNITVILDACHSGTGNRDNEADDYIRGTAYIFAPDNYIPKAGKSQDLSMKLKKEKGLSPITVLSACFPDEINYEYYCKQDSQYYGLLSYAFGRIISEGKLFQTEHEFYYSLKAKMQQLTSHKKNRKQSPFIESSDEKQGFRIEIPK